MHELKITFSDEEWKKLIELSKFRRLSVVECLRSFVRSCTPGGTGFVPPDKAAAEFWNRKEVK